MAEKTAVHIGFVIFCMAAVHGDTSNLKTAIHRTCESIPRPTFSRARLPPLENESVSESPKCLNALSHLSFSLYFKIYKK